MFNLSVPFRLAACFAGWTLLSTAAQGDQAYEAWHHVYGEQTAAGHAGNATTTDSRGNVIVAGYSMDANGLRRFYTAKYAAGDGSLLWEQIDLSSQNDGIARAVAVDSADNVIVTGRTADNGNNRNFYTVKYGGEQGTLLWARVYAGPQGGVDEGLKVVVDHHDDVIVAGYSYGSGTQEDWFLLKYTSALGSPVWGGKAEGIRISGSGNQRDLPAALAVDSQNNVLVAGQTTLSGGVSAMTTLKLSAAGSILWSKTLETNASGDSEATGLALDAADNIAVTGIARRGDDTRFGCTAEYNAGGTVLWSKTLDCGPNNFSGGPADVATDREGNVLVAATTQLGDAQSTKNITVVKYFGAQTAMGGEVAWETSSPSPDHSDFATRVGADGAGNAIVTGTSANTKDHSRDLYTARLTAKDGKLLSEFRFDGAGGADFPNDLALDDFGNVVVTGVVSLPLGQTNIRYDRLFTAKYSRLRLSTGDEAPGAGVPGSGVPAGARVSSLSTPALADTGEMTVRVGLTAGGVRLSAILEQSAGGANRLLAVQGQTAAGPGTGRYLSFADPIIAPDGRVAFTSRLSGVPVAQSTAVFVTDAGHQVERKLQSGLQVPNLTAGLLTRSILATHWQDGNLVAQLQLAGSGVKPSNSLLLYGSVQNFGGYQILRTGDSFTIPGQSASTITGFSAFTPAAGSPGQGRFYSANGLLVRLTLANHVSVDLRTNVYGINPTVREYTGGPTPVAGTKWKTLGLPAVCAQDLHAVLGGALQPAPGSVTAADAQVLLYSSGADNFSIFARQGGHDGNNVLYGSFADPLVNDEGGVAFLGTVGGPGVPPAQRAGLWYGVGQIPSSLQLVARAGTGAPDAAGVVPAVKPPLFSAFLSTALPGGAGAGPVLLARVAGPGVTARNNLGVWALDSQGLLRNLLRTGQTIGSRKVAAINLLLNTPGALGVSRSFDAAGSLEALVTFTDRTSAVMHLAVP